MKPLTNMELSSFSGQIALILKSGISSLEGITIMLEEAQGAEDRRLLEQIRETIENTGSFYQALTETSVFPPYLLRMAEIGEETGTLDEVMEALSFHYEREDAIRKSVRNALTYPLIMSGMMLIVIIVLLVRVMPIFNQVFVQLGTEMTGFSRALMGIGSAINRYSTVLLLLVVLIAALAIYCTQTVSGKAFSKRLGYRIGFTRSLFEQLAACRFASGMSLTLRSGLDPERSLELVAGLNEDDQFRKKIESCKTALSEGGDLSQALHTNGVFSGIYSRMANIGSKSGSLEQVMARIATLYQDEIDTRLNNILAILEPTLVIALSLIVGVILLSVMLPLMGIMSSL